MRPRGLILLVPVMVLAGCGSSGHHATTSGRAAVGTSTATASAGPAKPPAGLAGRVLTNNELSGFTGSPSIDRSLSQWEIDSQIPPAQQAADEKRLRQRGWLVGVREDLSDGNSPGLSVVEQFRTVQAARAETAFGIAQFKRAVATQGKYTTFPVPGIPRALGYGVVAGSDVGGINISFVKGTYAYTVGEVLGAQGSLKTSIADLVAAARHLYGRVSS